LPPRPQPRPRISRSTSHSSPVSQSLVFERARFAPQSIGTMTAPPIVARRTTTTVVEEIVQAALAPNAASTGARDVVLRNKASAETEDEVGRATKHIRSWSQWHHPLISATVFNGPGSRSRQRSAQPSHSRPRHQDGTRERYLGASRAGHGRCRKGRRGRGARDRGCRIWFVK
jgi:hypothetical protein